MYGHRRTNHVIPISRQNRTTFLGFLQRIESGGATSPMVWNLCLSVASHRWRKCDKSSSSTPHRGHILSVSWTLPRYAARCFEWPLLRRANMTSSFLESPSGRLGGLAYTPEARAEMTMLPLTLLAIAERADSKLIGAKQGRAKPATCEAASLATWSALSFPKRPT